MKEYKAIYNETFDTVTFFDENGEKHELYTHTVPENHYLKDMNLNFAYTKILHWIIAGMSPFFFLGCIKFSSSVVLEETNKLYYIISSVGFYLLASLLAWIFVSHGIHLLLKTDIFGINRKIEKFEKQDSMLGLVLTSFFVLFIPFILILLLVILMEME